MAVRTNIADTEELAEQEGGSADTAHVNDDFDDVFGSESGSPTFHDDDDDDDENFLEGREKAKGNAEWSDIPRLKEKHETEGYRDGVTKGKAESVQKGFDEGYSLGATLGLSIGKILGVLEGIYGAVQSVANDAATANAANDETATDWEAQRLRMEKLYANAKAELKTESVFAKEWWGEDGIWTFEVPGEKDEGKDVLFLDVAAAHPLVEKWEKVVGEEVKTWGLDLSLMEHEYEEKGVVKGAKSKEDPPASTAQGAAKELAW